MNQVVDLIESKVAKFLNPTDILHGLIETGWIFFAVLLLEVLLLGWQRSSLARLLARDGQSSRVDVVSTIFYYAGLDLLLGVVMVMGLASLMTRIAQQELHLDWTPLTNAHPWLRVVLGVIAVVFADFNYYWFHRLNHKLQLFWQVHRFHHSAEEFSVFTSVRTHPVESAFGMLVSAMPYALLGAPVGFVALSGVLARAISTLHHSKFSSSWGWVGRWLFVSPRMHSIHHSIDPRHYDTNFGFISPIWDRMFGTWTDEAAHPIRLGLADSGREARSWLIGVVASYLAFLRHLRPSFLARGPAQRGV